MRVVSPDVKGWADVPDPWRRAKHDGVVGFA